MTCGARVLGAATIFASLTLTAAACSSDMDNPAVMSPVTFAPVAPQPALMGNGFVAEVEGYGVGEVWFTDGFGNSNNYVVRLPWRGTFFDHSNGLVVRAVHHYDGAIGCGILGPSNRVLVQRTSEGGTGGEPVECRFVYTRSWEETHQ